MTSAEALVEVERHYARECARLSDIYTHLPVLRRYAAETEHVTEMGVRTVVSSWAFLVAQPPRMVSYDIVRGPEIDELVRLGTALTSFEFKLADTREAEIEETDLLFIDTDHTYARLKVELAKHAPQTRQWIILHDTVAFGAVGADGERPGLWSAVEEFVASSAGLWRILQHTADNNGLTILGRPF
jgi:hypothetical protein